MLDKLFSILVFTISFAVSSFIFPLDADAATPQRLVRDLKLPSQAMLEHQTITTPILASTNYIMTANDGPSSASAATVSSFAHQPDVPRNLTITPGGTTAHVNSCNVTVSGTNIKGAAISEVFAFTGGQSAATVGSKAFASVTSVAWAAGCEASTYDVTWTVGVGSKLGMNHCMAGAGYGIKGIFGGAADAGTWAASASAVESNTYTPAGTMDGATSVDLAFVQNYSCL